MKQLTNSQEIALKIRLEDIVSSAMSIIKLTRRMKKNHSCINAQYLQCLTDDADSVKVLVAEIKIRVL